jgi:hypothetical protein
MQHRNNSLQDDMPHTFMQVWDRVGPPSLLLQPLQGGADVPLQLSCYLQLLLLKIAGSNSSETYNKYQRTCSQNDR